MTAPVAIRRRLVGYRPLLLERPALMAELLSGWTWILLVELHAGPRHHAARGSLHAHLHAVPAVAAAGAGSALGAVVAGLPGWMLMSAAMMTPAAIPAAWHVGHNSLSWRRHRAVAEFLAAYLAWWAVFGAVALAVLWHWPPGRFALAAALAVAAAWHLMPLHTRVERACHRTTPLPPIGWAATRGALVAGARYGRACVLSCWPLMAVMAVATRGHLAWTAALTVAIAAQRLLIKPRRTAVVTGAALAASALVAFGVALA